MDDAEITRNAFPLAKPDEVMTMVIGDRWVNWAFTALFAVLADYSIVRVAALTRSSQVPMPVGAESAGAVNPVECGCTDQTAGERASSLAHAVMAVAMAAMFLPVPDPVPGALWIVLFAAMAAWFAAGLLRARTVGGLGAVRWTSVALHHVVGSLAMIYLSVMMPSGSGGMTGIEMGGMTMPDGKIDLVPVITTPLLLYFVADTVSSGRRLFRAPSGSAGALNSAQLLGTCHPDEPRHDCHAGSDAMTLALGEAGQPIDHGMLTPPSLLIAALPVAPAAGCSPCPVRSSHRLLAPPLSSHGNRPDQDFDVHDHARPAD